MNKILSLLNPRLIASLSVFLLSQIFFIALIHSAYYDYRAQNLSSMIELNVSSTASRINAITTLGRELQNYTQAPKEIAALKELSHSSDVFAVDRRGTVTVGESVTGFNELSLASLATGHFELEGKPYVAAAFYGADGRGSGYVVGSLSPDPDYAATHLAPGLSFYLTFGASLLASMALFVFIFLRTEKKAAKLQGTKRQAGFSRLKNFLLPFVLSQLLTLALFTPQLNALTKDYTEGLEQMALLSIGRDFDAVSRLGIAIEDIAGVEEHLNAVRERMPFIRALSLTAPDGTVLWGDPSPGRATLPLSFGDELLGKLALTAAIDPSVIVDLALKLGTLLIISVILAYELSSLLDYELRRISSGKSKVPFEPGLMRPLGFLIVVAIYLPVSIVPVYMGRFTSDLSFLSGDVVRALAVTTEMVAMCVASVLLLLLGRRLGTWKELLPRGLALMVLATLISYLAFNAVSFLIGRFLYGLAYSVLILSFQLYIIDVTDSHNRGRGMAGLFAGLFSGVLCGVAAGGLIADKVGQREVFISSCGLFILVCALTCYLMRRRLTPQRKETDNHVSAAPRLDYRKIFKFLRKPQVLTLLFCQVIPYSAIGIGFFNFFLPVTVADHGLGASTVGQLNFVYTLAVIFLTPLMGRLLDKLSRKYLLLGIALCASALVPLAFTLPNFIFAAMVALCLLGFSASVNEGGQPTLISSFEGAEEVGEETAVKLLDIVLRVGQIIGPLSIALIMTAGGLQSFLVLGAVVGTLALLFLGVQSLSTGTRHGV